MRKKICYIKDNKFNNGKYKTLQPVEIILENGSILVMREPTNKFWYHSLPRGDYKTTRINLTFRNIKRGK